MTLSEIRRRIDALKRRFARLNSGGDLRLGPTSARLDQSPAISHFAKLETPATNTFVVHYE